MKKPLLLDSFNLCSRGKYGMPDLRFNGEYTGAVMAYIRDLAVSAKMLERTCVVPCWDGGNRYRRSVYPEYKLKRTEKRKADETAFDKEAFHSFLKIRDEVLPALGFRNIMHEEGYECDDVMAWLCMHHGELGWDRPVMMTTDEDMYQCLRNGDMWNPSKNVMITREGFEASYGFPPEMWGLVKSAGGCSTDEVPGVKARSVGEGTAAAWVRGELSGKKLEHITGPTGVSVRNRNRKLVILPAPGFEPTKGIVRDELSMDKYLEVCASFGFRALMQEPYLTNWKWLVDNQ